MSAEDGVAETSVLSGEELIEHRLVQALRWCVQAQAARRERGDDPFALGFQQLFRQGAEVREVEVAVQAVHREQDGLARLRRERSQPRRVEDVLVGPEVDPAVADVAHQRRPGVEGVDDGIPGRG